MIRYNCDSNSFNKQYGRIIKILFGVSKELSKNGKIIGSGISLDNVDYIIDNDEKFQDKKVFVDGIEYNVYLPQVLLEEKREVAVIITSMRYESIYQILQQLTKMDLRDNIRVFSARLIIDRKKYCNTVIEEHNCKHIEKIEKKIHCFWGGGEKPDTIQGCLDSWKKHCPDYEIVEWNETNYDLEKNEYIKQAYQLKKWAFVSDYVRLDVVYNYGGIYMDFDVEVLKNLDNFLCFDAFMAFEASGLINIGSGMGAKAGHPLIKELLDQYEGAVFLDQDETYSSETITMQPTRQREVFEKYGYKNNGQTQIIDNIAFLSPDYINTVADPKHNKQYLRGNEHLVHWTHASWYDDAHQKEREENLKYRDMLYGLAWRNA